MMKFLLGVALGVIVFLVGSALTGAWNSTLDFSLMKSNLQSLNTQQEAMLNKINKIENDYSRLIGFIQGRLNFNYQNYVDISNKNKIPSDKFAQGLHELEKDPQKAKNYLQNTLQFTPIEVNAVFSPVKLKPAN